MSKAKKTTWRDVKIILSEKGKGELLKLIGDLYSLNKDNKAFINSRSRKRHGYRLDISILGKRSRAPHLLYCRALEVQGVRLRTLPASHLQHPVNAYSSVYCGKTGVVIP